MTQLRNGCQCGKCRVSNELDTILKGIGHRGSSFMDFDAVFHDGATQRFLVLEVKRTGEALDRAARYALTDLSRERNFTVWYLQFWQNGQFMWADMRRPDSLDVLTIDELRARVRAWWDNEYEIRA